MVIFMFARLIATRMLNLRKIVKIYLQILQNLYNMRKIEYRNWGVEVVCLFTL